LAKLNLRGPGKGPPKIAVGSSNILAKLNLRGPGKGPPEIAVGSCDIFGEAKPSRSGGAANASDEKALRRRYLLERGRRWPLGEATDFSL
jgi:hypothetical protein